MTMRLLAFATVAPCAKTGAGTAMARFAYGARFAKREVAQCKRASRLQRPKTSPPAGIENQKESEMSKTVLITGGGGVIGLHLSGALLRRGPPVRILARPAPPGHRG